jgi:acetylornithine deacetylase/succinyl-diaminopimelate desuccinylase-like protein
MDPRVVAEVEQETSRLLSELIRIDTSNPPGNETAVARFMATWFCDAGLVGDIVGEPQDRRSFVLRVDGQRRGPSLLLLSHEDVVPAEPDGWRFPPFSGAIEDGYVWGRGALDMKNTLAAHAVAVRRLATAGFAGTIVFACTADEEEGSAAGAEWLATHRPDLVRTDYALSEGGGSFFMRNGRRVYLLGVGEKGTASFRIVVHGDAGHASMPLHQRAAIVGAAEVIQALTRHPLPLAVGEASRDLVEYLVGDDDLRRRLRDPRATRRALDDVLTHDMPVARLIEPLLGFTFAPTIVHSNTSVLNVYPTRVEIDVDCRTPVGCSESEVEAEVRAALAGVDAEWEFEWIDVTHGHASPYPTRLSDCVQTALTRCVPEARLAATHFTGFTDSYWLRSSRPQTVAYGFCPHLVEEHDTVMQRVHNVDERISLRDLAFQALFTEAVATELLQ